MPRRSRASRNLQLATPHTSPENLDPKRDIKGTEEKTEEPSETMQQFKSRLTYWLQQMMFVSGETAEPSAETTWMIEEIVRDQVIEMVRFCCVV